MPWLFQSLPASQPLWRSESRTIWPIPKIKPKNSWTVFVRSSVYRNLSIFLSSLGITDCDSGCSFDHRMRIFTYIFYFIWCKDSLLMYIKNQKFNYISPININHTLRFALFNFGYRSISLWEFSYSIKALKPGIWFLNDEELKPELNFVGNWCYMKFLMGKWIVNLLTFTN